MNESIGCSQDHSERKPPRYINHTPLSKQIESKKPDTDSAQSEGLDPEDHFYVTYSHRAQALRDIIGLAMDMNGFESAPKIIHKYTNLLPPEILNELKSIISSMENRRDELRRLREMISNLPAATQLNILLKSRIRSHFTPNGPFTVKWTALAPIVTFDDNSDLQELFKLMKNKPIHKNFNVNGFFTSTSGEDGIIFTKKLKWKSDEEDTIRHELHHAFFSIEMRNFLLERLELVPESNEQDRITNDQLVANYNSKLRAYYSESWADEIIAFLSADRDANILRGSIYDYAEIVVNIFKKLNRGAVSDDRLEALSKLITDYYHQLKSELLERTLSEIKRLNDLGIDWSKIAYMLSPFKFECWANVITQFIEEYQLRNHNIDEAIHTLITKFPSSHARRITPREKRKRKRNRQDKRREEHYSLLSSAFKN